MSLTQDNKGSIPISCTAHQRNNVPSKNYPETDRFLEFRIHLMKNRKNSREKEEGLDESSVQSPHSPSPKWRACELDEITIVSSQYMQGFCLGYFLYKSKTSFFYPALLTVDGWFHIFSCKGLGKS